MEVQPVKVFREHVNSVDAIAVCRAHSTTQFASGSHDKTLKLWDVNRDQAVMTSEPSAHGIWCLHYNKDGSKLLSASPDGTAKVYDVKYARPVLTFQGNEKKCYWSDWDADAQIITTCGSDHKVYTFDIRNTSKPVDSLKLESVLLSLDYFPGNQHLVVTSLEGDVSILKQEKGKLNLVVNMSMQNEEVRSNICFSSMTYKGKDQGNRFLIGSESKQISRMHFDSAQGEIVLEDRFEGHSNSVRHIVCHPSNNRWVLSCCEDHSMRLWDGEDRSTQLLFTGHTDLVAWADFLTPTTFVSGSWDQKVALWNIPDRFS